MRTYNFAKNYATLPTLDSVCLMTQIHEYKENRPCLSRPKWTL